MNAGLKYLPALIGWSLGINTSDNNSNSNINNKNDNNNINSESNNSNSSNNDNKKDLVMTIAMYKLWLELCSIHSSFF